METQSLREAIRQGAAQFRELPRWQQEALMREAESTRVAEEDRSPPRPTNAASAGD